MSKNKGEGTRRAERKASPDQPSKRAANIPQKENRLISLALPIAGLYLLLLIFFAPVVFQAMGLSNAADMIAAAGMYRMGEEAIHSGHFPLWNPTLFCGMPLFASLQYALWTYPPEFVIRTFGYLFGGSDYRIWIFHYLLAALFAYLLARHFGCGRLAAWVSGVIYGFSPQLIVLADVGHGSKLMAMTWLPLIWLMLDRLRLKPNLGRAAALGAVFAVEILALHPQVAAYGALLMALYLLYHLVAAIKQKALRAFGKVAGYWAGAMALSLALSAALWVSVLDYARFSIRGAADAGVAGGGVGWDYATGWSFHPLESITYLFPGFMGFGGQTYWGTVGTPQGQPFTSNPMYFGCAALLLAILAVALLPKGKWGFPVMLGLTAWVLSFGRYLPILYGPLFHLLPLFNKFRAPVMGQVILLLPAAILAGMGLEQLLAPNQSGGEKGKGVSSPERLIKSLWWIAGIFAGIAVITLAAPGLFASIYRAFADIIRPGTQAKLLQMAGDIARTDVARVGALLAITAGFAALTMKRKVPGQVFAAVVVLVMLVDLFPVNRKLVNFTPRSERTRLFEADGIVKKIQSDTDGKFRVHPLDGQYRAVNWWSYFGLETTVGYFGAKPAAFQKLMNGAGLEGWQALYARPQILDALNVRYVVSSMSLNALFDELHKRGAGDPARELKEWTPVTMVRGGAYLYRNTHELPRARLVGQYRVIGDVDPTISEMVGGSYDPTREVLLDREPFVKPVESANAKAEITDYQHERVTISTTSDSPQILVLADEYYPSGWSATIDGKPADILRADGVLRAVALPAGDHKVEFVFKPKWFWAGLGVSGVSLACILVIGAVSLFAFKKRAA